MPTVIRQAGYCSIVILCGCFVFGAGPCLGRILSSESDAAGEECGSSKHLALSAPGSQHGRENSHSAPARMATHRGRSDSSTVRRGLPFHCGHRLSNGLRAPLRC
ncbi:MAG: hypothetical protein WD063_02480 [Pirellulales bacterium]